MILAVVTVGAPTLAQEELPPGTPLLEGEIVRGGTGNDNLLDGRVKPGAGGGFVVGVQYQVTENVWQLFLVRGDDSDDSDALFGVGVLVYREQWNMRDSTGDYYSDFSRVVEFDLDASVSDSGTVLGTVTVSLPFDAMTVHKYEGFLEDAPQEQDWTVGPFVGSFKGTWSRREQTLTGQITAGWIDSTFEAKQTGVQLAPRPQPVPELFVSTGPYGIDLEQLRSLFGEDCVPPPFTDDPGAWIEMCRRVLSFDFEVPPEGFAIALTGVVNRLFPVRPVTPFANVGVQQLVSRLAQHAVNNPDEPERLGALVRFVNFNLSIAAAGRS